MKKISDYITKKVADKLSGMCKTDRENYEKYWDDIAPFIKFGYIKDEKFAEKMGDFILYKNLEGKYLTLQDCLDENKEKHENTIFYVTNEKEQSQYINMFKEEGIDAVIMPAAIDSPFISHVEQKKEGLKFLRIDKMCIRDSDSRGAQVMAVFRRNRSDIRSTSIRSTTGVQGRTVFFRNSSGLSRTGDWKGIVQSFLYVYGKREYTAFLCVY